MSAPVERRRTYARTACISCRQGKRRCNKALPVCELCDTKEWTCKYPANSRSSQPRKTQSTHQRATSSTPTLEQSPSSPEQPQFSGVTSSLPSFNNAAALSFIAPEMFQDAQLDVPRVDLPVPSDVAAMVGDDAKIRETAALFFKYTISWMPIISRRRFYNSLLNPLSNRRGELSFLALSMQLFVTPPIEGGDSRTTMYRLLKQYHFEIEAAGVLSIHILQASAFLAFYEMAQGIYPGAYFTVGACARYGVALDIDKLATSLMGDDRRRQSWIEVEEARRVWWAVLILDRFMNVGNPKRFVATRDPAFDDYLPVDDQAFDDGTTQPEDATSICTGFTLKMGLFSRLCQTTYLLGQVLKSVSPLSPSTDESLDGETSSVDSEATQLRRTLHSLVVLADAEAKIRNLEFCPQSGLCYIAIFLLQEHHWRGLHARHKDRREKPSLDIFPETRNAIESLSRMTPCLRRGFTHWPHVKPSLSTFSIHALYHAAMTLITIGAGTPDDETIDRIGIIKELLQLLTEQWHIASIYLSIIEAKEATATLPALQ